MFKIYHGPLPIHPRIYVLILSACRSGDVSAAKSHFEEYDVSEMICLYKDTMREDAIELVVLFRVFVLQLRSN